MKRILSVWLPTWPIDRMRRADPFAVPDDRPFALVMPGARGIVITAVNARARAEGVKAGDTLSDARAAFPHLLTRRAEPHKDATALMDLVRWCGRYGPARNADGEDGLWIDVTGVAHLFGGETSLINDLVNRLSSFGLTVRCGLGDSAAAAFALAHFRPHGEESSRAPSGRREFAIAPAGEIKRALAALPVEALRLEDAAVLLLKRLGLRRIGQLYDLPRSALARRFQSVSSSRSARKIRGISEMAGSVLGRLDLALGSEPEANRPFLEKPPHIVRQAFAEPLISAEAIEATVGELVASLCDLLDRAAVGARRMRLSFYRVDGTVAEVQAGTAKPCREPRHLSHLLKEKLSTIDAGFGIDLVALEATAAERLAPMQTVLTTPLENEARTDAAFLIDKLANRLGEQVFQLRAFESHIPERAQRHVSPLVKRVAPSFLTARRSLTRPPLLLSSPEPILVLAEVPEGAPAQFQWRRVSHRIARAAGPERIEPEWWEALRRPSLSGDEDAARLPRPRDYYCLEDDQGGRFWVYRDGLYGRGSEEGAPLWYMHGLFG